MVAFKDPINAINWMLRSQLELMRVDWPERLMELENAHFEVDSIGKMIFRGLRVRMGGGMCKPDIERDSLGKIDYFGNDVNQAARVGSIAVGGQIIIHENLYQKIIPRLSELTLRGEVREPITSFLGKYALKGIEGVHNLYDVLPASIHHRKSLFPLVCDEAKGTLWKPQDTAVDYVKITFPAENQQNNDPINQGD